MMQCETRGTIGYKLHMILRRSMFYVWHAIRVRRWCGMSVWHVVVHWMQGVPIIALCNYVIIQKGRLSSGFTRKLIKHLQEGVNTHCNHRQDGDLDAFSHHLEQSHVVRFPICSLWMGKYNGTINFVGMHENWGGLMIWLCTRYHFWFGTKCVYNNSYIFNADTDFCVIDLLSSITVGGVAGVVGW